MKTVFVCLVDNKRVVGQSLHAVLYTLLVHYELAEAVRLVELVLRLRNVRQLATIYKTSHSSVDHLLSSYSEVRITVCLVTVMCQRRNSYRCGHFSYFGSNSTVEYYNQHVCLSVCLWACLRNQISKHHWNFCVCCLLCILVLLWLHCNMLYTSSFVDDVMFSHNGPCGTGYASRM